MTNQVPFQMAGNAAVIYQSEFVPALFGPWAEMILDHAGLDAGARILDVACGTGAGARAAAPRVGAAGSVIGLDFNADMLAVARERSPDLEWVEGSVQALPFEDEAFDGVISLFGIMFFPDKPGALREMMRVLKPGGRMVVAVWHDHEHCPGYGTLVDLLREHAGDAPANWMHNPFSMGDVDELRGLCAEAGLAGAAIDTLAGHARFRSIERWINTQLRGTPVSGLLDEAQCQAVLAAAPQAFARYVTSEGDVATAMEAHVISAVKP